MHAHWRIYIEITFYSGTRLNSCKLALSIRTSSAVVRAAGLTTSTRVDDISDLDEDWLNFTLETSDSLSKDSGRPSWPGEPKLRAN